MPAPTAISFSYIPQGLRVPLFYAEFTTAANQSNQQVQKTLLIGQPLAANPLPSTLTFLGSKANAQGLAGRGSMLARMAAAYFADDTFGELWALPLADAGEAVAATGSISFTGPSTAAGTLSLYIGGVAVPVAVSSGMTAAALATAVAAAINGNPDLALSAAVDGADDYKVDLTAKNAGTLGNDIDVRLNYYGLAGGEAVPAGISVTLTGSPPSSSVMSGGATDPDLAGVAAIIADNPFDFIVCPYTETTQLNEIQAMMNQSAGRWAYSRQSYGHVWSSKRFYGANEAAATGNITTFATARNDPHVMIDCFYDSPTPSEERAADFCAASAVSLRADPARPLQTLPLSAVLAPPIASRFSFADKQAILSQGGALVDYDQSNTARILRAVTTYQTNAWGTPDQSYLDTETLFTLMAFIRRMKAMVTQTFPRSKLAANGTSYASQNAFDLNIGAAIATPNSIRAALVAEYQNMVDDGLVQDTEAFAAGLIVQINADDASRVDVLLDPVLVGGLRIFAALTAFLLQDPSNTNLAA
jgi:phage tail sheath gpL-like